MIITSGGVKGWNTMGYLTPNPVCFKDICKKKTVLVLIITTKKMF